MNYRQLLLLVSLLAPSNPNQESQPILLTIGGKGRNGVGAFLNYVKTC